jgi:hypothetical protein
MEEIENKSRSVFIFNTIGVILLLDGILFAMTGVMCWLLDALNWNTFFSALFYVGLLISCVGVLFGTDSDLANPAALWGKGLPLYFPNSAFTKAGRVGRIVKGSPVGIYIMFAGLAAVILSMIIPLLFPN